MLQAILDLVVAIKSGNIRGILSAIADVISHLVQGSEVPSVAISRAGETHPTDTTKATTITLG